MKICVYTISKNEENHVERWYNSIKDADKIYVLDTGSTDNTVKLLKERGVVVLEKNYESFRFDIARNDNLKMIDDDIDVCISLDLDEVLVDGWRNIIEKYFDEDSDRLRYIYNWKMDKDDNPLVSFYTDKIHRNKIYSWVNPVHEILKCNKSDEAIKTYSNVLIKHYPDASKSRGSYLNLLELSIKENPENDRNMHYLGREYMYYKRYQDSIDTLTKYLSLKSATWKEERCASCRFIARCYYQLGKIKEANMWYLEALKECSLSKEANAEYGIYLYNIGSYFESIGYFIKALSINQDNYTYIQEVFCNDSTIEDLMSVDYFNLGLYDVSLFYAKKALSKCIDNQRIIDNIKIIENKIKDLQ